MIRIYTSEWREVFDFAVEQGIIESLLDNISHLENLYTESVTDVNLFHDRAPHSFGFSITPHNITDKPFLVGGMIYDRHRKAWSCHT